MLSVVLNVTATNLAFHDWTVVSFVALRMFFSKQVCEAAGVGHEVDKNHEWIGESEERFDLNLLLSYKVLGKTS